MTLSMPSSVVIEASTKVYAVMRRWFDVVMPRGMANSASDLNYDDDYEQRRFTAGFEKQQPNRLDTTPIREGGRPDMKRWFNRLKVSQKLMLICIFFVMPDSLMLYFFITGINANIDFAQLEKKGDEYQRPLEELLDLIPQHGALAAGALAGEPGLREKLAKKQAQIDAAFRELQGVDDRLGVELQFTDEGLAKHKREHCRVGTVKAEWQELKTQLAQLQPEACAEKHLHLMADVRLMITHAGDMSNLILDPQLDSYYLVDVTLMALPQTQDRLAAVMALGGGILKRQTITSPEQQQMAIYATLLKEDDLDRITDSLKTSLNANPEFYGGSASFQARVPPVFKEYAAAAERFISLTTRLVASEKFDVTAKDYLAAGSEARDTSFKLWRIAGEELDTLLDKRIEYYQHRRAKSLMVAALAVMAAITLVTFITRSISGPLRQQAAELNAANNALRTEIAERKQAEAELEKMHQQLVETSRQAGMAEVATGVLHNVGNVLNSLSVSVTLVGSQLRGADIPNLRRATAMLRGKNGSLAEFLTTDPKGRLLPEYLGAAAEQLADDQTQMVAEMDSVCKHIEHIKEIVTMQQNYAKVSGAFENLAVAGLVEDALQMNAAAFDRHHVNVVREMAQDVPAVCVDRHKVLQILINLFSNAKYAMEAQNPPSKQLVIRVEKAASDRVKVIVSDNGIGIAADNLVKIFTSGFTTKNDGHGFGLHSGANAAREIGGSLSVQSDGLGLGARFILELPVAALKKPSMAAQTTS
jgi:signal transduction histidine kinase